MHPRDPRANPNHHERGPKRFSYTFDDIARAAGLSLGTIKNATSQGKLDPSNLESVIEFVNLRRQGDRP